MIFEIPNELIPYVRVSKKKGLVCSDDLPQALKPLFDETKHIYEETEKERLSELEGMLVDESN